MQSSNQVDSPVPRDSTFVTSTLAPGPAPAAAGQAVGDTEDYPEITVDLSSLPAAVTPPLAPAPDVKAQADESEPTLWEGRTSPKTFLVRFVVGEVATIAWVGLAVATWGFGYANLSFLTYAVGIALLLFWAITGIRLFRGSQSLLPTHDQTPFHIDRPHPAPDRPDRPPAGQGPLRPPRHARILARPRTRRRDLLRTNVAASNSRRHRGATPGHGSHLAAGTLRAGFQDFPGRKRLTSQSSQPRDWQNSGGNQYAG